MGCRDGKGPLRTFEISRLACCAPFLAAFIQAQPLGWHNMAENHSIEFQQHENNDKKIRSKSAIKMTAVAHPNTSGWGIKPFAGQRAPAPSCPEEESVRACQGAFLHRFLSSVRTPSIRPQINGGEMRRSAGPRSLPGSGRRDRHWTDGLFPALPGCRYPVGRQGLVPGERGRCSPYPCCYPGDSR